MKYKSVPDYKSLYFKATSEIRTLKREIESSKQYQGTLLARANEIEKRYKEVYDELSNLKKGTTNNEDSSNDVREQQDGHSCGT